MESSIESKTAQTGPTKLWNRSFVSVFLAYSLLSIGLEMCNVLIGKFTQSMGATPTIIGIVASSIAITSLIFKCVSAPAIDAFDRHHVLMAAVFLVMIAFCGYGISSGIQSVISFRLVQGIGQAFTATCCIALAADALPREKMGTGMGIFTLGAGIAQMVSPTTALYISHLFGYKTLFFVAAGVMALVIVLAFNISMPARERRPFKISVKNIIAKEALAPAFLLFCTYSCYSLVNSFLVVFATEKGLGLHIGYFFTVYAVMLFGVRPIAGYLFDRWGSSVLIPFFALFVTAFFVISFASELWEFLLAAVIFALGYGSCQPVLQAMTMKLVPSERRGAGSSTNFIGSDLGNLVGPSLGGLVAENFGYPAMWRVMTISLIIAIGTVVILRKRLARKQGVATSAGSSIR